MEGNGHGSNWLSANTICPQPQRRNGGCFINIAEVENTGYYVASNNNNIKYMGSILIAARGQVEDNWNMYNAEGELWAPFKDVKTKQLTINIYDYLGDITTSSFLSTTLFLILECELQ